MTDEIKEFVKRRDKALIELDMEYAREMMADATNDEVRLISLHKARYECTNIADDLRLESGQWLLERRYKRMTGEDILVDDMLPE